MPVVPGSTGGFSTFYKTIGDISESFADVLKSWEKTQFPGESPSDTGNVSYTSFGPGYNEYATTYQFGKGAHNLRLLNRISTDILLVHKSKMVGFYFKVQSGILTIPVSRQVKNMLLKESSFIDFTNL